MAFSSTRVMQGVAGGVGLPAKSHVFDGTNDLSISSSNWGTGYTVSKKAISLWFKLTSGSGDYVLYSRSDASNNQEFRLTHDNGGSLVMTIGKGSSSSVATYVSSTGVTDTNWHHVLVHYDEALGASTRINMWIDGTEDGATSSATDVTSKRNSATEVGYASHNSIGRMNGKLYQATYFDNRLPAISEVYDSGNPKNLINSAGVYSMLNADNDSPVKDLKLPDWTNNGSVTLSTDVP